jgi:hypothetical protein
VASDANVKHIGKMFAGSPRHMQEYAQDAMRQRPANTPGNDLRTGCSYEVEFQSRGF